MLLPAISRFDIAFGFGDRPAGGESDPSFSIDRFSTNHEPMAKKLNEFKDIFIYHYKQNENVHLS